jgi:hypothetical protein
MESNREKAEDKADLRANVERNLQDANSDTPSFLLNSNKLHSSICRSFENHGWLLVEVIPYKGHPLDFIWCLSVFVATQGSQIGAKQTRAQDEKIDF